MSIEIKQITDSSELTYIFEDFLLDGQSINTLIDLPEITMTEENFADVVKDHILFYGCYYDDNLCGYIAFVNDYEIHFGRLSWVTDRMFYKFAAVAINWIDRINIPVKAYIPSDRIKVIALAKKLGVDYIAV